MQHNMLIEALDVISWIIAINQSTEQGCNYKHTYREIKVVLCMKQNEVVEPIAFQVCCKKIRSLYI